MYNNRLVNTIDNNHIITLQAINLLHNSKLYNIEKVIEIYRKLYDKKNNVDKDKYLIFEIWLNYITQQLINTDKLLNSCNNFLNKYDNSDNKINTLSNTEINNIYKFLYIEKQKYNI